MQFGMVEVGVRSAGGTLIPSASVATWEPAWSSTHKKWFYQDRKSGTSCWKPPPGCTLELPRDPPPNADRDNNQQDLPPGWESEWDAKHSKYYYYNRQTRERSWQKPATTPTTHPAPTSCDPVAEGWVHAEAQSRAGPETGATGSKKSGGLQASGIIASLGGGGASRGASGTAVAADSRANRSADLPALQGGGIVRVTPVTLPQPHSPGVGGRAQVARNSDWDAEGFLRRLAQAKATGDQREAKKVRREVAENNYALRARWPVPRTVYMTADKCLRSRMPSTGRSPVVSFSEDTTVDAILAFALERGHRVCALNFANGSTVGGGYKNGALAQEEDLCRRIPCLYTSLNNAKRDGLYPFGPATCSSPDTPAKYSDVLWTPGIMVARAGEAAGYSLLPPDRQVTVSLVAAAAPNLRFADPPEIFDRGLMYSTVKAIFIAPRIFDPELTTIILGAWGCGAFGGDPREVSALFCRALAEDGLGRLYREVHFAIPKSGQEDRNADAFREALRRHKIVFQDRASGRP